MAQTAWKSVGPAVLAAISVLLGPAVTSERTAVAGAPTFGPNDVPTAFFIDKSQNRNRVDYGVRLDASCLPVGDEPVFAYWREFEKTPLRLSGLMPAERGVYGVGKQRIARRDETGAEVVVKLKKLDREVVITTRRQDDGHCAAVARTLIAGVTSAQLASAHVQLKSPLIIAYVEIRGTDPASGAPIAERVKP